MDSNLPTAEMILAVGGILSILIVAQYLKNRALLRYKVLLLFGLIGGVGMIAVCLASYAEWGTPTAVLIAVAGFTLAFRPFRNVHFAALIAILVMIIAYILLDGLSGTLLDFLSVGWPRIITAFAAGAIVYGLLNFAESIIDLFGKLFNCWPLLLLLGIICIIEAISLYFGYGTIFDALSDLSSQGQ
ncbi:MAG: hypothetical protein LBT41_05695 [Candidatus Methanoplasma sp.]|jgi:hypothetical protein|nr:hypothetical protein [Candidatus Methanoplasma sp.]